MNPITKKVTFTCTEATANLLETLASIAGVQNVTIEEENV